MRVLQNKKTSLWLNRILKTLLLLAGAILFFPDALVFNPGVNLDASWSIGVQTAIQDQFVFGRDIVFNYGPLGYLLIRLPFGTSLPIVVLFDSFILAHVLAILVYIVRSVHSPLGLALALLTTLVLGAMIPYVEMLQILFLCLFAFDMYCYLARGSAWALAAAFILSAVLWLVKLNPGIPLVLAFIGFLGYLLVRPHAHSRWLVLGVLGVYGLTFAALAYWLRVDLPGYWVGALHVIDPYNDAMFLPIEPNTLPTLYAAMIVMLAYIAISLWNIPGLWRDLDQALAFVFTGLMLFIAFKYSFVRADSHVRGFFYASAPALGLLVLFARGKAQRHVLAVFLLALLFSSQHLLELTPTFFQTRMQHNANYIAAVLHPPAPPDPLNDPSFDNLRLPASFISRIDQGSVDVVPIDIFLVYIHGLNYNPRPMIQTMSTYDNYLDEINLQKYNAPNAPDFLLFSVVDIDERHPFFTEMRTKLAILSHYEIAERSDKYLLLVRRPAPLLCQVHLIIESQAQLGEMVSIPDDAGLVIMRPEIRYSLLGRLARTFFQPPMLKVAVRQARERIQKSRAIVPIVNNGVIVSPYVDDLASAESWLASNGVQATPVRSLRFETPAAWGFEPTYTYRLYEVLIGTQPGSESSDLAACNQALR